MSPLATCDLTYMVIPNILHKLLYNLMLLSVNSRRVARHKAILGYRALLIISRV